MKIRLNEEETFERQLSNCLKSFLQFKNIDLVSMCNINTFSNVM